MKQSLQNPEKNRLLGWWTRACPRSVHTGRGREVPLPSLCISPIFSWIICFYNQLVDASLSSVSHTSKLIQPVEGSREPLIYSQLVRSTGDTELTCWHVKCVCGGGSWDWALTLWDLTLSPGRQVSEWGWIVGPPVCVQWELDWVYCSVVLHPPPKRGGILSLIIAPKDLTWSKQSIF